MKIKHEAGARCIFLRLPVFVFLILSIFSSHTATAQSTLNKNLKVARSYRHALEIELKVSNFQTETVQHKDQVYQRFIIQDMVQNTRPGEPEVPTCGALLGIPSDKDVTIQILKSHYKILKGHHLYPAPYIRAIENTTDNLSDGNIEQEFSPNREIYTANDLYPRKIADIDYTGYMRDQAVAHVQFYPVQYNPVTGEVRLYQHILVRVTWNSAHILKPQRFPGFNQDYEDMLKNTILNYRFLNRSHHASKASANPLPDNAKTVVSLSPSPTLKIGVKEDGVYKLTYADITNKGFSLTNVNPHMLKILNRGTEIPIYVYGEEDGVFDTTDYILFYGTAITDKYTSKNIYWLSTSESNGLRMNKRSCNPSGSAPVATYFPASLHAETDTFYWQNIPNGKDQDHWFWGDKLTAPATMDYPLVLNNISPTADNAHVQVQLRGYTTISNINPDHHTRIYINNTLIDDKRWDGQAVFDHDVSIPHSYLLEGTNTARVEIVKDTGATVDQVFLNWIRINYFDTYVAENNKLVFTAPLSNTLQFHVTGFTNSDIEVFDITNPNNVVLITDANISTSENGLSTVQFEDTPPQGTQYLAQLSTQRKIPVSIENDQPSNWKSPAKGADYIIITHDDFYSYALKLANYRSAIGLKVVTVKTSDIYDEFNYGIFNPQAIRDFLTYTYHNWVAPAPLYVLLVGDGCYDFKDNLKTGSINYVPSQTVETTIMGETPSDNWFVLVSGDDILPDMFIGRLSAQSTSQANNIINKIIYYEKNIPDKSWNKNVLLVADDNETVFNQLSDDVARLLPFNYNANKVYVSTYTTDLINPTTDIMNYINNGSVLVNYSGHGSMSSWGAWNGKIFFDNSYVNALTNTNKLPFVTTLNCMNGYFTGLKSQTSLAEAFQRPDGKGAIAVLAASGWSYPSGQRVLIRNLYKTIFEKNLFYLGAATTAAKINTYTTFNSLKELVEMFVLFGDPLTQLGIGSRLTILTPNGNEIIPTGTSLPIQWASSRDVANFTLNYSTDNGNTWVTIAAHIKGTQYSWSPPIFETDKNACLIQITGFDSTDTEIIKDVSNSTFTLLGKGTQLEIVTPNGSEIISPDVPYTIKWVASKDMVNFALSYSTDNGVTWTTIADRVNGTQYEWSIPAFATNKTACLIQIAGFNSNGMEILRDASDSSFTLLGTNTQLAIITPNGNEVIPSGAPYTIKWIASQNITNFTLSYSIDNGTTWILIAEQINAKQYDWNAPNYEADMHKCLIRIIGFDSSNEVVSTDTSDATFTIIDVDTTAPVVTIASPVSDDTYSSTTDLISLGGSASDGGSGISNVTWSSDKGGSGTASGTTNWTIANISLAVGDTKITVTATDGAGNTGTDTIMVNYSPSGLQALYTFNEGSGMIAYDTSGNSNNGTVKGATWTTGKKGSALNFNGTSSYVSVSNSLSSFSEFTCSAWVQVADLAVNKGVFTSGGSNSRGFRFRVNKDGSVWLLMAGGGTYNTVSTVAGFIQSGSFHHITVTGKSGQYMRIYIDGMLATEKITTQIVDTPTAPGYIGTSWSTTSELMNGIVDDVRIYNRALSDQEVLGLYNMDSTTSPVPAGSISINNGKAYTNSPAVLLNLSATDDVGVVGYYLSSSNVVPSATSVGWLDVTPVPVYSGTVPYTLSSGVGSKTVYVWYKDSAGNISATANDSIDVDTTSPVVAIASPSSEPTYTTTTNTINLGGSVTESGSGVASVTWSSDKGGSGMATGTTSWTISNISLTIGNTIITVTATDGAGNTGKAIITVTYTISGLNALYPFNEGSGIIAHDTSGNGNNGNVNNTIWTNGKNGSALSYNGTSSYVSLSKSLPAFSEFTCAAWVQVADLAATRGVFTSGGSNASGFRFRVNTNGSVWLLMAGGGTFNTVSTAAGIIKSGTFYHITVTGKSGQYMRIYANGVIATEKITTQTIATPTAPGYIGTSWSTTSELMNGIIDDVRIYNRALSDQEVMALYNAQ